MVFDFIKINKTFIIFAFKFIQQINNQISTVNCYNYD